MGWRGNHNRELMLEEEGRAAFAALPAQARFLIRLERAAYGLTAAAFIAFLIWWKWSS